MFGPFRSVIFVVKVVGETSVASFPLEFCDFDESYGIQAFVGGDLLKVLNAVIDYGAEELLLIDTVSK